ncbi:MAG: glycosyltransferase family 2 protein [Erysipelotrichaceae bacterium]
MQFKIKDCTMFGIKNPLLNLNGWIESSAKYLEIRDAQQVYQRYSLELATSDTCLFDFQSTIKTTKLSNKFFVVAIDAKEQEEILLSFYSSPFSRLIAKLKTNTSKKFIKNYYQDYHSALENCCSMRKTEDYHNWINKYEHFNNLENYDYQPKLSVIIPVYNVSKKYLSECLDSILQQSYQNFEICLADDCSSNQETLETLKAYQDKDQRIKVVYRTENGHISLASNSALAIATGEFVVMMDNDDTIEKTAFNEFIKVLNEDRNLDFIYSDEDKIDEFNKRTDPQFKPDLAIDKLYGGNYICHLNMVRRTIINQIGGFRKGYEGAQDFDLFLRVLAVTQNFKHIPKVLYHWRMIEGSTALNSSSKNYAGEAGKQALTDYFTQKNIAVKVYTLIHTHYFVEYQLKIQPTVQIIMEIKDVNSFNANLIEKMLTNLSYQNYFVTFITQHQDLKDKLANISFKYEVIIVDDLFTKTINKIVKTSSYEYLLFLNEYASLENFNALSLMVGYTSNSDHGAVGAKIFNERNHIIDSGSFLLRNKIVPACISTFAADFGVYATLLVPNNYRLLSDVCFMLTKANFLAVDGLNEKLGSDSYYDLFMKLDQIKLRNVFVPQVEVVLSKQYLKNTIKKSTIKYWQEVGYNCHSDKYYNENLSKELAFFLDK